MLGFFARWLVAFILLAATFNPTRWNYASWVQSNLDHRISLAVLLGLILFVGYVIYLRATLRSIGAFGMLLVLAIVGASLWVLRDFGLLTVRDTSQMVWLALVALSLVLGIGLSWSHVRRQLSGQYDIDDVEE